MALICSQFLSSAPAAAAATAEKQKVLLLCLETVDVIYLCQHWMRSEKLLLSYRRNRLHAIEYFEI